MNGTSGTKTSEKGTAIDSRISTTLVKSERLQNTGHLGVAIYAPTPYSTALS
jgi:hypothetical protein